LPIGVRAVDMMTASLMKNSFFPRSCNRAGSGY
jgi:hypothetical protein